MMGCEESRELVACDDLIDKRESNYRDEPVLPHGSVWKILFHRENSGTDRCYSGRILPISYLGDF